MLMYLIIVLIVERRWMLRRYGRIFTKDIIAVQTIESKHVKWIHGREIAREYLGNEPVHAEYENYHCSGCGANTDEVE